MTIDVPPFMRKLSWAQKHIENLEASIGDFGHRHPYRARKLAQNDNKGPWVLEFTEDADPDWSLMVGDILYNLRATLEYLAGLLNPSSQRSHVMFPVMRQKVWEIAPIDGENESLTDNRHKWDVSTRHMDPRAIAHIKGLMPTDPHLYEPYFHPLDLLNRLSNKDRHRTLHIHISGLVPTKLEFYTREMDGTFSKWGGAPEVPLPPDGKQGLAAIKHNTEIALPIDQLDSVVKVDIEGTTTQAIKMGNDDRHVIVPDAFRQMLTWIRDRAVVPLSPYLHGL